MKTGEMVFIAALFGIPLWLLVRVWARYLAVDGCASAKLFQMRAGLALISASTIMWVAVFVVMILQDDSAGASSIARTLSPGLVGSVNILLCIGGTRELRISRNARSEFRTSQESPRCKLRLPDVHMVVHCVQPTLISWGAMLLVT